jgi:hypothetical protein
VRDLRFSDHPLSLLKRRNRILLLETLARSINALLNPKRINDTL